MLNKKWITVTIIKILLLMMLKKKYRLKLLWNKYGILLINSLKEFVLDFDNLRKGTVTES